MPPSGFAVVDVETTGFVAERERIVEVAVVVLDEQGERLEEFCTLVDPGRGAGPTHVHGITDEMVAGAPTYAEVLPYVASLLSGRVVVGHNIDRFDLSFLRAEAVRALGPDGDPGPVVTLDTLTMAQRHLDLPGRFRLVECCDYFSLSWTDHHNALGDARITGELLGCLRARFGDATLGLTQSLRRASAITWPGQEAVPVLPPIRVRAEATS